MFDISEKLLSEQSDKIYGVIQLTGCFLMETLINGDEEVISLSHAKACVLSHSVFCFGKMKENPQSNIAWEDRLKWFKSSSVSRASDTTDGEPMEYLPRIHNIAACP